LVVIFKSTLHATVQNNGINGACCDCVIWLLCVMKQY